MKLKLLQKKYAPLKVISFFLTMLFILSACSQKKVDIEKESLILKKVSEGINADFVAIRKEVQKLAKITEELYEEKNIAINLSKVDKSKYVIHENGIMYKPKDDKKTAVFVSGFVEIDKKLKDIVYFTEPIEDKFIEIVNRVPEVVQAYYNDEFSYNRIYPYFDVISQYEPKMNIPEFNFYYLADQKHNPSKKGVWVNEPYVDPAGRGWMVSAIAPVYFEEKLMGVPGLDVTINTISKRYLSDPSNNFIIFNRDGIVVSTNEFISKLFSFPPLKNHLYSETIKSDTYKTDDYNILKSKSTSVRNLAENIFRGNEKVIVFKSEQFEYTIFQGIISELDWIILKVVEAK